MSKPSRSRKRARTSALLAASRSALVPTAMISSTPKIVDSNRDSAQEPPERAARPRGRYGRCDRHPRPSRQFRQIIQHAESPGVADICDQAENRVGANVDKCAAARTHQGDWICRRWRKKSLRAPVPRRRFPQPRRHVGQRAARHHFFFRPAAQPHGQAAGSNRS